MSKYNEILQNCELIRMVREWEKVKIFFRCIDASIELARIDKMISFDEFFELTHVLHEERKKLLKRRGWIES